MKRKSVVLALAILLCSAAMGLYFWLRGPVGGVSPYETVNDLYEWEYMTFTADQAVYPTDVETITLYFRNDAPDDVVILSDHPDFQWYLERQTGGAWHTMRSKVEMPQWRFREEDCTLTSTPSGVVRWGGGEFTWYCDIGGYYRTPLEPGSYRIVIPNCVHVRNTGSVLAVGFEVE
ncbi:hypothetical protein [uncultured Dysosmobacter sp.]|uniref:hypothetical protein n=1 Tax=uncultured Dysosmobacter sp. TaxID=2591384 RepID=UPI002620DAAA|nr:hypothetical protein [uncultured Dysosmobacter sp.]